MLGHRAEGPGGHFCCKDDSKSMCLWDSWPVHQISLQGIFYQRCMIVSVIFRHLKFKCSEAETGNCLSAQRQNSLLSQVRGGKLKARKGVNVPEVQIDCAALTEKDIEDPNVGIRNHSVNDSLRGSNS